MSAQIPVRFNFIAHLVVIVRRVFLALAVTEVSGLAEKIDAAVSVESGHAALGELEMIGAKVAALLRLGVGRQRSATRGGCLAQAVFERGLAQANDRDVAGAAQ